MDEGCESVYLNRLRGIHDAKAHVDTIADEMAEEMARALGRTASAADYSYALLERARDAHAAAAAGADRDAAADAFEAQRAVAARARQDLLIHRQALGFKTSNYETVDRCWPLAALRALDAPEVEGDYASLTVPRLKAACRRRSLPVGGVKADLVDRLVQDDAKRDPAPWRKATKTYSKGRNWGGFRVF